MIPLKPSGQKALWCQPINDFVRCFVMLIGLLRFSVSWIQFLKNTFPGKSSICLKLKYINTWLRIWNILSTQLYPVYNQCCFIPSLSFLLITAIFFHYCHSSQVPATTSNAIIFVFSRISFTYLYYFLTPGSLRVLSVCLWDFGNLLKQMPNLFHSFLTIESC